jgi:hypothetical protein
MKYKAGEFAPVLEAAHATEKQGGVDYRRQ